MATLIKKENISVVIDTYTDRQTGQEKSKRRTIGEIVTMQGDDGSYFQFGELWGPHGCTKFNIYEQQDQAQQQPQQQHYQQPQAPAPQQYYQAAAPQQQYHQPAQPPHGAPAGYGAGPGAYSPK